MKAKKERKSIKQLLTDGYGFVRTHWNTPLEGEYLSIKEFASYCFGTMGICGFTFITGETVAFAAGYFCGSIMGISLLDFSIISIIALIVRYCTLYMEPLAMTVFENLGKVNKKTAKKCIIAYSVTIAVGIGCYFIPSAPFEKVIKGLPQIVANILVISGAGNFINWFIRAKLCPKFGRYKPFMMLYGIPVAILSSAIPFIPTSMEYTQKLIILHALFTLRTRCTLLYSDSPQSIVAVITPNTVERQKIYSIGGIFLGFLRSMYRILFPVMIVLTGGYLDIKSYQVFIPILSAVSLILGLAFANVKERVAEDKSETPKVEFKKSAKSLLSNKYFWIIYISNIFVTWNSYADGVMNYFLVYNLRLEWISGFITIIGVTSVVGNLLTPVLVKKFEKRSILLVLRSIWLCITACYLLAIKLNSITLLMLFIFIRSAVSACCNGLNHGFNADVLDYHQWKTGERADNMVGIFNWFTTPLNTLVGLAIPMLLKMFGFTSDWDVMYDSSIFTGVVRIYVFVTMGALVLSTLPYIFYNLTRAEHDRCVKEIQERFANNGQPSVAAIPITPEGVALEGDGMVPAEVAAEVVKEIVEEIESDEKKA